MPDTVHVLLPLSLLEAIRNVDTPEGGDIEYVQELRNKRFGLSDTVYAQIRRYADAMKRGQPIAVDEATSLARLIGRRADAEQVFRNAGRIIANRMYERLPRATRQLTHILPKFVARPIAFRRMRQAFSKYLDGSLRKSGRHLILEVTNSVTIAGSSGAEGCTFYAAAIAELLRLVAGDGVTVDHVGCRKTGARSCEWSADWGQHKRPAGTSSSGTADA